MLSLAGAVHGQLIIADNYNVTGNGSGFALDNGVNSGINPPTTRLTGSAAADLRYIQTITGTPKALTSYTINNNKLQVAAAANSGRFVFSADGTVPFDFGPALGASLATPSAPLTYDVTISIANSAAGTQRTSFGIATAEGDVTTFDFGVQLYRAASADTFYNIQKRIDVASNGLADQNTSIGTTAPGTSGSELNFLIRVIDAGAETTTFSSQVKVSLDGGATFFYDTATDSSLVNGWRFDGAGRYFIWDVAGSAAPTYDNFSVTVVPEPSTIALAGLGCAAFFLMRYRGGNSRKH